MVIGDQLVTTMWSLAGLKGPASGQADRRSDRVRAPGQSHLPQTECSSCFANKPAKSIPPIGQLQAFVRSVAAVATRAARMLQAGAASLEEHLVPTVSLPLEPGGQATRDFPGQKRPHVPMTSCGPYGFGHGDMDDGDTIVLRSICCFR